MPHAVRPRPTAAVRGRPAHGPAGGGRAAWGAAWGAAVALAAGGCAGGARVTASAPVPIAGPTVAAAATPGDPRVGATLRRLRAEGLERSRVLEMATVLSDVFGPRLAGSDGYRAAAAWARATLAGYGLSARLEPWGTRGGARWEAVRHSVELVTPYRARLVAYPYAWSPSTRGEVRGTPLLLGAAPRTVEEAAALVDSLGTPALRGRIVLLGAVPRAGVRFAPLATRWSDAAQAGRSAPGRPTTRPGWPWRSRRCGC